ncbi:MAG: hypothetical protein OXH19_14410 [Chloroflexi bacterium]|nr:hypothetical protein [Chloroflexota bacterium]MCY3588242.1 hypothetical protein [Chloroflexota bacterium]MCY3684939.1 hypothetical protein [Chloroflexota bacterium]MDE2707593.1 hypothetical protein [Chloroflexota bacterium]
MPALTAANHTTHANPPLPFTRDAIINQLQRQATNGPAYVQHSATKALAHLKSLYAEARYEAKQRFDAVRDAAKDHVDQAHDAGAEITRKLNQYMEEAGVTSLADFSPLATKSKSEQDDDEEAAKMDDDDVP